MSDKMREALKRLADLCAENGLWPDTVNAAREALAERPAQGEPVGELCEFVYGRGQVFWFKYPPDGTKLYTGAPAPSVPDDAQIDTLMRQIGETVECHAKHWGLPMYGEWPEFYRQQVRAMLAAAPSPSVPEGWKLVPAKPTHDWIQAAGSRGIRIGSVESALTDLLAAAPEVPRG